MLSKLLHFELKAFGRVMFPLYLILLATSVIMSAGIKLLPNAVKDTAFFAIFPFMFVAVLIAISVMTIVLLITRFSKNLLGKEGYLMFSLPVSSGQLVASKLLSNVIFMFASFVVGSLSACMIGVILVGRESLKLITDGYLIKMLQSAGMRAPMILMVLLIILAACATETLRIYAALSLGSQWNDHRSLGSVLSYIGFKIVELIIAGILSKIGLDTVGDRIMDSLPVLGQMTLALIFVIIIGAIYWAITSCLLNRRLNLE